MAESDNKRFSSEEASEEEDESVGIAYEHMNSISGVGAVSGLKVTALQCKWKKGYQEPGFASMPKNEPELAGGGFLEEEVVKEGEDGIVFSKTQRL